MKNELAPGDRAQLDLQWFAKFDKLAAEHGAHRVTYAMVTREFSCSTSTIGDRLKRWKLNYAAAQEAGVPTWYAALMRLQFDQLNSHVAVDVASEKAAHQRTQADLENSQKQCDMLERDFRAREKTLTDRIAELEKALRTKTLECDQRDKVLAAQSGELHELKATVRHQQELIQTLQATVRTNDVALTELRQQLQQRQSEIVRYQRNEDRLNVQLDSVRQKLKQSETKEGAPPRPKPRTRKTQRSGGGQ